MRQLVPLSVVTAILCGVWMEFSGQFGILTWGGFAGCTSFFAAGGKISGLKKSLFASLSGVIWAVVIIWITAKYQFPFSGAIIVAVVVFFMCYQATFQFLSFIPGTFIGCFSTFAVGGEYLTLIPALSLGILLGYSCEYGTHLVQKYLRWDGATEE